MNISRASCSHASSPTLYVTWNLMLSFNISPDSQQQEKLNEAVMVLNKSLQVCLAAFNVNEGAILTMIQEINVQNMNVELVAQMFKNYQSNVLFHLEGRFNR
jgi:hypothetical protein